MYRGKNIKKNCWTICFSSFLDFDKKILYFCRKVFARVVKNTFDLSSGTLTEQDFRMQVLKTRVFLDNFWSFRDNGGTLFSGLAKQQKMSAGTVYEKIFSKEKNSIFFRFCAIFYFQRNFSPELRNTQSMYPWKFLGKNSFWNIYNLSHFFRTLIQRTLSRKETFLPGCHNCNRRVPETVSEKKYFFFKKVLFVHLFWSLSNFSCLLTKNSQGVKETTY